MKRAPFRVFGRVRVADLLGQDTHVIPFNSRVKRAFVGYCPVFDVGLEEVRILFRKLGRSRHRLSRARATTRKSARRYSKRASRVSSRWLLPSAPAGSQAHCGSGKRRLFARAVSGLKSPSPFSRNRPPCQHDRKRHFIQLDACPIRLAVDPEVLREIRHPRVARRQGRSTRAKEWLCRQQPGAQWRC